MLLWSKPGHRWHQGATISSLGSYQPSREEPSLSSCSRIQSQGSDRLDMRFPIQCLASVLLLQLLVHQVNTASVNHEQPSLLNLDLASFLKDEDVASSRKLPDSSDSLAEPKVEEDEAPSRLDLSLDTSNSKIIGVSALDGSQNLLKAWQTSLNGIWDNIGWCNVLPFLTQFSYFLASRGLPE